MALLKLKIGLLSPYWALKNRKARKLFKKAERDEVKYPINYQWKYLLTRTKRVLRAFKADIEIKGYENLPKGSALLIPNHQSNFDILVIIYALQKQSFEEGVHHKKARFLAKKELEKKKSLRGWMQLSRSSFIDRKNPRDSLKTLNDFGKGVKESGDYGVIFAEGTRSKNGELSNFHSGAFRLAKQEFLPIIPVTINRTQELEKMTGKKVKVTITFEKLIKPITFMSQPNDKVAERVKKIVEKNYVPVEIQKIKSRKFK